MILQAFIDDSGNEPTTPVFVLAGFISTHEKWAAFSDEWKARISQSPGVDYFKMAEAEHFRDEFSRSKGWNEEIATRC